MGMKHQLYVVLILWLPISFAQGMQYYVREPVDQTVAQGETIIIPCRVKNKRGVLQWTRDGFGLGTERNLPGFERYRMITNGEEGDYTLQIDHVTLEDDARFQCQVGPAGEVPAIRSRSAQVTVLIEPEPPEILQGTQMDTRAEDKPIRLECVCRGGKPAATLTWLDGNGNEMAGDTFIESYSPGDKRQNARSVLRFKPTTEHHNKQFTCQAHNPALSEPLEAKIRLLVKYPPRVKLYLENKRIVEFDKVRIRCTAEANPKDVHFKWYRDGTLYAGNQTTELVIPSVRREYHGSEISCEVSNVIGSNRVKLVLNIAYGPQFLTKQPVIEAEPGSDATLICDVDGNPRPRITWSHLESNPKKVLSTKKAFTIKSVSLVDAGTYRCRAVVDGFPEVWTDTKVLIKGPPSIQSAMSQYGALGDTVHLECTVSSVPAADAILWVHQGKVINLDNPRYNVIEEPTGNGVRNTLIIHESTEQDFGEYNCSVSNSYGADVSEIQLRREKSPPLLYILSSVLGGVTIIAFVILLIFRCQKRSKDADDSSKEKNHTQPPNVIETGPKTNQQTDQMSNSSDVKVEIRTASSHDSNENDAEWEDGVMNSKSALYPNHTYRYSADYIEPTFPAKEGQGNNGYIPYCDYRRDYNPPALAPNRGSVYGSQNIDSRYPPGNYNGPYVRTSVNHVAPTPHSSGAVTSGHNSVGHPVGSTSGVHGTPVTLGHIDSTVTTMAGTGLPPVSASSNGLPYVSSVLLNNTRSNATTKTPQQYITQPKAAQPGILATHV